LTSLVSDLAHVLLEFVDADSVLLQGRHHLLQAGGDLSLVLLELRGGNGFLALEDVERLDLRLGRRELDLQQLGILGSPPDLAGETVLDLAQLAFVVLAH
jgi:hypothetical protein